MFQYNKFLEFPIKIKRTNPKLANVIITQYGGAYCKCLSIGKMATIYSEKYNFVLIY